MGRRLWLLLESRGSEPSMRAMIGPGSVREGPAGDGEIRSVALLRLEYAFH